jgi:hypothetical protein
MSLTTSPERPTSLPWDSNSSEWADEEDMSRVSYADVIDSKTCGAVSNLRPDITTQNIATTTANHIKQLCAIQFELK